MKKQYKVGEEVYLECYTSMGSGSNGYEIISDVDHRYDAKTGEKFPVYEVNEKWYDGRSGVCYSHPKFMFGICLDDITHEFTPDDKKFLWSLLPTWVKEVPPAIDVSDPTFYGTLTYEGDMEVHNKVKKLLDINGQKYKNFDYICGNNVE